jgi:type IV fimbrial biogenesis protein FimT
MQGFAALAARRTQRGLTLIEACATLAIGAVLVGTALPSFEDTRQRSRLEGVAGELVTDLHYARGEAVTRNEGVRFSFRSGAGGTCTLVHTGANVDCQCDAAGTATCSNGATLLKASFHPLSAGVSVSANVASMRFDEGNGTVTPAGSVTIAAAKGQSLRHVVNIMGRVRTCSPAASVKNVKPC